MKLFAATTLTLSLFASAFAQTNQAIKITRSGSQPSQQAPAENFTGSVRVEPLFQANAPARASGRSGHVRAWRSVCVALPSARPDSDRDGGRGPSSALGRPGRGDSARRHRLDSARPKTLARGRAE